VFFKARPRSLARDGSAFSRSTYVAFATLHVKRAGGDASRPVAALPQRDRRSSL